MLPCTHFGVSPLTPGASFKRKTRLNAKVAKTRTKHFGKNMDKKTSHKESMPWKKLDFLASKHHSRAKMTHEHSL